MLSQVTSFDGLMLSYSESGAGRAVILIHGFASSAHINWIRTGLFARLAESGWRVVAPDMRGHGRSDAPHNVASYQDHAMARDISSLIDSLGLESVNLVGYSMGSGVALRTALDDSRIAGLFLGGVGGNIFRKPARAAEIVAALETDEPVSAYAQSFRDFADLTRSDRFALAAIQRGGLERFTPAELVGLAIPVTLLTAIGDTTAGGPQPLAEALGIVVVQIPGTHLNVVTTKAFADAIEAYLRGS